MGPFHHHHESCSRGWHRWHRGGEEDGVSTMFGVRRPLRFLAFKLGLDERQVAALADVIDDLKTERAQAAVDDRRAHKLFVDAISGGTFDDQKAAEARDGRVESARRVQEAVLVALRRTHEILNDEQRKQLGYLIRSGALSF